jgi:hypothetical protein
MHPLENNGLWSWKKIQSLFQKKQKADASEQMKLF